MKVQIFSDIHLDKCNDFPKIKKLSNILILAGNIGNIGYINTKTYKNFIEYISKTWEKIIIINGNNEYFSKKIDKQNFDLKYNNFFDKYKNIVFLNNSTTKIKNKVLVLGTTLWSQIPANKRRIDINSLRSFFISEDKYNEMNNNSKEWIFKTLRECKKNYEKIIILTHFPLKIENTLSPKYINEPYKSIYANDILNEIKELKDNNSNLINTEIISISGHTHYSYDFIDEETNIRCISNQCGYIQELITNETKFKKDGLYNI